jgi:hypothetical protein
MLRYRGLLGVLVLIMLLFYWAPRESRAQDDSIPPTFPLEVGAYWDYQGSVKWGSEVRLSPTGQEREAWMR